MTRKYLTEIDKSSRKFSLCFNKFSLCFNSHFSTWTWVSRYHILSILYFIGAKDDGDGGDYCWTYKMCKAPVNLSASTSQNPSFYRPDALPVTQNLKQNAFKSQVVKMIDNVSELLEENAVLKLGFCK